MGFCPFVLFQSTCSLQKTTGRLFTNIKLIFTNDLLFFSDDSVLHSVILTTEGRKNLCPSCLMVTDSSSLRSSE